jgi:hypothetical protein
MTRDKTSFKCRRYRRAIHAGSDEDELLPTVAERRAPVRVDSGDRFASGRPVLLWGRRPPTTEGPSVGQAAGDAVLEDEVGVGLDPEPALGAEDARHGAGEDSVDPAGIEWPAGAPDERFDAVLLGFGGVVLVPVQLLDPERAGAGLLEVEEAGVEDVGQRDVAEVGLDDPCAWVEAADDAAGVGQPFRTGGGNVVEDDNVAASTTVSIVSSRATSERLTPAASRKSKVAATGSGSEMPVDSTSR